MATYSRPGVFIEESLLPLSDTASSTSDSIAAFVGKTNRGGPLGPTLVTSWSQYRALFGEISASTDDLGYGVFSFFNNGGSQAYIVRAVNSNATPASKAFVDDGALAGEGGTAKTSFTATAKSPGAWASNESNGVYLTVQPAESGRFDLIVEVGQGISRVAREQFVDLSLEPGDYRNAVSLINSPTVGSKYVRLVEGTGAFGTGYDNPVAVGPTLLTGGTDGTGSPSYFNAVQTLGGLESNLTVNLPGVADTTVLTDVINWAESVGNVFVVVDGPRPSATDGPLEVATALEALVSSLPASSYAAVYGPYLYMSDPASRVAGALRLTAPGGAVMGQYAVSDSSRGVQKAPAGTSTALKGVIDVHTRFDNGTLDALNLKNANVIRSVPGAGFCIMGGRTLNVGMPDRYINIRRSLMFLKRDLVSLSQFAIFEVNDPNTWEVLREVISQYLMTQWQVGVLSGSTVNQAYFVVCDETNNSATSVNAGVVNVEVGVALNSPAEFIIIRIGQFDGGTTVTDSTSDDVNVSA